MTDEVFRVRFDDALRSDLRDRLARIRWNDAVTAGWQYGMDQQVLAELVQYWSTVYDFDAAEHRLNSMPHYRANIAGFGVHYVHVKGEGSRRTPLLLMNGWPSSFAEYGKLASRLANPAAFGGTPAEDFDVVMPAHPGFGFSDRPTRPYQVTAEDLFHTLMTDHLGYTSYVASGTDIGAGVATRLGLRPSRGVRGIHISAVVDPPLGSPSRPLSTAESLYKASVERWQAQEGAYLHLQVTKPQSLAFALADSPVGLASWIVEKFYFWSDHGADLFQTFSLDLLIDNLMIYWVTGTIGSSMRYYYDSRHYRPALKVGDHVGVPTAVCMWPKDLVLAPREWAERFYTVHQYSTPAHGGHFPAWEAPDLYAQDLRRFVATLER